ncbi:flavin reductase family protein [Nitratireductor mangrovi]|uniref:Flavin reductase family protein n=1 Tax=Nitratireductor mangrovi TaxID=2599600 RepID=A0A5B8KXE3_9HYPH|nr:flavin reductase family protein [Nitratireductor mangrovi]QDZ00364.1 flavin reductase family protein [Nitratireductor mangrovi]
MSSRRPARTDRKVRRGQTGGDANVTGKDEQRAWPAVGEFEFKAAIRQVASAVFVLTARSGEKVSGLTATSLCSVSSEPPLVLVSVNSQATVERLVSESGAFAVNFLSEDQHRIGRLFTGTEFTSRERFAEGVWEKLVTGAPILDAAMATFDCVVESTFVHGSHTIFFGRVVAALSLDQECLIYRDGSFRRLAPVI